MSGVYRSCYAKHWDPAFSTDREFNEDWSRSFVDRKRDIGAVGEGIELFLQDVEDSDIDDKVEELKDFVAPVTLDDLKQGIGPAGHRRGAWLDERSITSQTREHKNPLTATQLYQRLGTPRIGNGSAPDADRRLIYIKNMDALYMLALAETAVSHEVPLLRDAIWKHYDRQTSLKVGIATKSLSKKYKIFKLEFHVKYWVYGSPPPANETNSRVKWIDLSFLEVQTTKALEVKKHGMYESHFSFVIYGSHEHRWAAYAFDDTEADAEELYDKIFPCEGMHQDPIASDNDTDAEFPIKDPREYFLKILAPRVGGIADSWETLLRAIERRIDEYRVRHPSTLSHLGSKKGDHGETVKIYDWTRRTIELVNKMRKTLSETNKLWEQFNSVNGDIECFSDSSSSKNSSSVDFQNRIKPSLCEINETFQRLQTLQRTLDDLSVSCKDSANALDLRLTLENNEATKESSEATKSSGTITDFTTFVLVPIALAAACLQYSPALMPFPPPISLVLLTGIFMVGIKMLLWLHVLSGVIPGFGWWWKIIKARLKVMELQNGERPASVWAFSRLVRKHRSNIDRKASDVEMDPVPS